MWSRKKQQNQTAQKISWNSLRTRILLFVLFVFFPIFALVLVAAEDQRRDDLDDARNDAYYLTQIIASEYTQQIEATRKVLITLSHIPAVQEHDTPACDPLFADLL